MELAAQHVIDKLLTETGHVLTVGDYDDLARMNALAKAVRCPADEDEQSLWAAPALAGAALLYPLTLGAALWIEENVLPWFGETGMSDLTMAWALTQRHTPERIWAISGPRECTRVVKKWARRLNCTRDELTAALNKLLPVNETTGEPEDKEGRSSYGPVITLLCREYGQSPTYWLWEIGVSVVHAHLADYNAKIDAERAEARKLSSQSGGGKRTQTSIPIPRLEQRKAFEKHVRELRAKWQT